MDTIVIFKHLSE